MNLLERETNESVVRHFRVQQYMLYKELIQNSMRYLFSHDLKYDPEHYDIDNDPVTIKTDSTYHGSDYYAADLLTIKLWPDSVTRDYFLYAYMPKLVEETFFRLNGNYFIPLLYITDEPIVKKLKSVAIYSLFHPMTIYVTDNRVTFMRDNYELVDFIQVLIYDWIDKDISKLEQYGLKFDATKNTELYELFAKKLNCNPDPAEIKLKINRLMFDNWTYELYETYYGIPPTIDVLIKIAFDKLLTEGVKAFSSLYDKRLTFIEPLMRGFFKQVSFVTSQLMKGKQHHSLMMPKNGFAQHFLNALNNQTFYDTVNGFSSIISHKATFKNPAAQSDLPSSISELHESHMCRICSNAISSQKPGEMISLVPDQDISMRFGIFKQQQYEMENFTI